MSYTPHPHFIYLFRRRDMPLVLEALENVETDNRMPLVKEVGLGFSKKV